jgi:NAD(P)-dependent dehydrogenase (short-subunit alcohol dehydrogenase family)
MVWRVNSAGVHDGKVAVVTGTSRGVGIGIAHELFRAGATVIGCGAPDFVNGNTKSRTCSEIASVRWRRSDGGDRHRP